MSRFTGRTQEEIRAAAISGALITALCRLSSLYGDPEIVLDCLAADCMVQSQTPGLSAQQREELALAVAALRMVYIGGPVPDRLRILCAYHAAPEDSEVQS